MNIMTAHCYSCLLQQPVTTNTTMSGYERRYTSSAESRAARLRRLPDCDGVVTQVKVEYASADINGFYNKEGKSDGVAKFTKPSSEHDGKKYMIFRSAHTDGSRRLLQTIGCLPSIPKPAIFGVVVFRTQMMQRINRIEC